MRNVGIKLAIFSLTWIFACNSKPKGVLSEDKMAEILVDLKVEEAHVDNIYLRSIDSSKIMYDYLENKVLKKHKVDTSIYNLSYTYYLSNKTKMLEIFNKSEKILEALDGSHLKTDSAKNEKPGNNSHLQRDREY